MFGGGRQSFREHLGESLAAVTSWQVDFKTEGLVMESCGKGDLSYHNRRFNCVQLKFCGLVERRAALDSFSRLVHQLDQLTVNGRFEVTLKHDVLTSDAHCDHGAQSHNVHHALTTISSIEVVLARRRHKSCCVGGLRFVIFSLPSRCRQGEDTGEKEVVVVPQKIDEERLGALLTPPRLRTLAQTDFGHVRRV